MMVMLQHGYLNQLYHMFTYIQLQYTSEIVLDPTVYDINTYQFVAEDGQHNIYSKEEEGLSPNTPKPRGMVLHR